MTPWIGGVLAGVLLLLAGCGVVDVHPSGPPIHSNTEWVLLPWLNRAEAPRVGERLEPVLATLLRARGVEMVRRTPPLDAADQLPILDDDLRLARAKEWALQEGIQYGVLGRSPSGATRRDSTANPRSV